MAIKVNDHLIPDWAIQGQAQSLFESVARQMPEKPHEFIQLAAIDMAKDRLIDQTLMSQESNRRNYEVDSAEVSRRMKEWIDQNGGKKAFNSGNHPVIKTKNDLRKEIINQIKFNILLEEESRCAEISEEDARKYYESRPDLFTSKLLFKASHILKKAASEKEYELAKSSIDAIRERIENGEDFVELARRESDDAKNDGNLGTFGKGKMVAEFERAALTLESGELSQPVKTQFGWHLIFLHEKIQPRLTPFAEVKEKIIHFLGEKKKDKVFEEFLDRLKQESDISDFSGI